MDVENFLHDTPTPGRKVGNNFCVSKEECLHLTLRQSYFAAISYVDDQFGRLMSGISTICPSFFEDVVVVVTSDHGWSLGEHGEWSKYSNFDYELSQKMLTLLKGKSFILRSSC